MMPTTCAFCGKDFGRPWGFILLSYCIAWENGRPCNKPFCPDCSTEEQRQMILCPDHLPAPAVVTAAPPP